LHTTLAAALKPGNAWLTALRNSAPWKHAALLQDAAPIAAAAVEYEAPGIAQRPAPVDDEGNPAAKKRARRLFGALMGTLAKARRATNVTQLLAPHVRPSSGPALLLR